MIKDLLILTIFPGAMALAAATDLFTMTVPNRIALVLVGAFFVVAPLGRPRLDRYRAPCRPRAGRARGDLRLLLVWVDRRRRRQAVRRHLPLARACSDARPTASTPPCSAAASRCCSWLWRGLPLPVALISQDWLARLHSPREGVPYGIALAAAGLLVYPDTPFMAALGG